MIDQTVAAKMVAAALFYAVQWTPYSMPEDGVARPVVVQVQSMPPQLAMQYIPGDNLIAVNQAIVFEDSPAIMSMLVHEVVHYLQAINDAPLERTYCDMEQEAYPVGWAYAMEHDVQFVLSPVAVGSMICTEYSARYAPAKTGDRSTLCALRPAECNDADY